MNKKKELAYSRALVPLKNRLRKKIAISIVVIICLMIPILCFFNCKSEGNNSPCSELLNSRKDIIIEESKFK